jgi:hypothetical protein
VPLLSWWKPFGTSIFKWVGDLNLHRVALFVVVVPIIPTKYYALAGRTQQGFVNVTMHIGEIVSPMVFKLRIAANDLHRCSVGAMPTPLKSAE